MKQLQPITIGHRTIRIPIFQGGMGVGVSLANLAGAVAAAGGVGTLSGVYMGYREPDFYQDPMAANLRAMDHQIRRARQLAGGGVIAINLMVAMNHYEDMVKQAVSSGIDMIVSGAGLPLNLPKLVTDPDVLLAPIVSSARAAGLICRSWSRSSDRLPDLLVVEGPLAGGHLGFSKDELLGGVAETLSELVRGVKQTLKEWEDKIGRRIPIIAAGGIFDQKDVAEVLAAGADGVQLGTRFVATAECDADEAFKQAYVKAEPEDVRIIQSPVGMPGRAIRNDFVVAGEQGRIPVTRCTRCLAPCDPKTTPYCISEALMRSVKGEIDQGLIFCGANAWRIDRITTVQSIFDELTK
ncbi:MAG TPA: nitronate monooxygenase [Tissierellia bacterium]|nr:nitronate monooxygenase [Tissierellia bacterium]